MRRVYQDSWLFQDTLDSIIADKVFCIAGGSSLYVPEENTKYINRSVCKDWRDGDGEMVLMTPGEAARTELNRDFGPRNYSFARKSQFPLLDTSPPMFFGGPRVGHGTYFDLSGAYWQIYRWLSLDVLWPRGSGSTEYWLYDVAERLAHWKAARNSVVGLARSHTMTTYRGEVRKEQPFRNVFFAPMFWMTIQDVLHDLAATAMRHKAVYIATDGYIIPHKQVAKFRTFLDSWDLEYTEMSGNYDIRFFGGYHLETPGGRRLKTTKPFLTHKPRKRQTKIFNVQPTTDDLQTLRFWSAQRERFQVML